MDGEGINIAEFLAKPTHEYRELLKKEDWIIVITHYQIPLPSHSSKISKHKIKDIAVQYL